MELTRLQATVLLRALQIAMDPKSPPLMEHERKIIEDQLGQKVADAISEGE